jgi:hypothetical protein
MANVKISELSPLVTVQDADVLPIVDNAITKKVTAAILRTYTEGNSVLLTGAQTIAGIKTFTAQLASSVATGTAPFSVASTTKVTNLNADLLDGLSSADFQAPLSGTGIVKSTAGTISYLTDNSSNWNTAFNDKINSAAVTGSGTNTLTLTQQDAGTITATWVNGTLIREIRNNTGATLTKGTIVYISGATGNKPTVTKAIATGDSTSAQTFGFVQESIANNGVGYVVVIGDLIGLDTSAFTEGDQLYLSSTVAGAFTSVKQYAPNHLVYVGIVTRAHPTLGQIEVNIQNGYELDELHNVAAQSPSNGDILQYVTSTGLWTKIAGTTTNISEGTNLYFTNARSRSAISLTTTGTSGAATYNSTTGVLNVPNYLDTDTGITSLNGLTALTQTFAVGTSGTDFAISSATSTHTFNLPTASAANRGALSSADWSTFSAKIGGSGTTNYLPKFTGASALGNSSIYTTGTNIAIGGTTAYSRLELTGPATAYSNSPSIIFSDNAGTADSRRWLIGNVATTYGSLNFAVSTTNATDPTNSKMTITKEGNVGIGTTAPASKFQVVTATNENVSIGSLASIPTGRTLILQTTALGGSIETYSSLTAGYVPLLLNTNGANVLIGTTTNSTFLLDVNGTARVVGSVTTNSASGFRLDSAGSILFSLGYSGGTLLDRLTGTSFRIAENGTPQLTFATGGAATFSSSVSTGGNITINTTSANGATSLLLKTSDSGSANNTIRWQNSTNVNQAGIGSNFNIGDAGALEFLNGSTTNMMLRGNGNLLIGTTTEATGGKLQVTGGISTTTGLSLSGATAPASGIQFPATQVASASANNLDDYEEGTWTMGVSFGGASVGVVYFANSGQYTKIGRQVTVTGYLGITNKGTSVGNATITGLPFTSGTGNSFLSGTALSVQNISFINQIFSSVVANATTIEMIETTSAGLATTITNADFQNGSVIILQQTYFV